MATLDPKTFFQRREDDPAYAQAVKIARQQAGLDPGQEVEITPIGFQTSQQRQAAFTAAGVPITSADLAPVQAPQIPPQPQDMTDYSGLLGGGQATIDANNKNLTTPPSTSDTDLTNLFNKYLGSQKAPPSLSDLYKTASTDAGIDILGQDVLTQQRGLKTAQAKLASLNAQLAGFTTEQKAIPIRIQEESLGRGRTAAGIAPLETADLRNLALRALPVQAAAYGAQAEVQAAQGNVELAQSTLKLAQDRLDTIFQIKSQDATNQYNYQKDLRDKVFDFASKIQQNKLTAQQKNDDRAFTLYNNLINDATALAKDLTLNGQADLGSQIMARIGKSTGFKLDIALQGDLAALQAQAKEIALPSDIQSFKAFFPNVDITTASGRQQFLDWQAQAKAAERKGISTLADLTPAQQSAAFKLSDDFEQASKDFFKVRDAYNRISASATDPSAAGDLALIFNYMKILDPGSVVREGEFATAQNSAGVPDRIRAQYNKTIEGTRLAPATREDFVNRSQKLFDNALKQQKEVSGAFSKRAEAFGIPSSFVIREVESVVPQLPKAPKTDEDAQNILENISTGKPIVQPSTFWPDTWNQITSFFGF